MHHCMSSGQLVGLLEPLGVLFHHLELVVEAGGAYFLERLGAELAVEIVHGRALRQPLEHVEHGVEREGDPCGALHEAILVDELDGLFHGCVFLQLVFVLLDLEHHFQAGVLGEVGQVLVEGGDVLAVGQLELSHVGSF